MTTTIHLRMPRNEIPDYENTERWQKTSDDWVKTMTESKKNKELYQEYVSKTRKPIPYRDWLKEQNETI